MTSQRPRRILIVDDDANAREALRELLEARGYIVVALGDGADALEHLRTSARPNLIVLDLLMPGMDGWDFRHRQREDPALAGIPVIALSGAGKLIDVDVCLRKPVDIGELLLTIERTIA
jgi:CheY-like chemotaxis protein